jgi:hypothetical protein
MVIGHCIVKTQIRAYTVFNNRLSGYLTCRVQHNIFYMNFSENIPGYGELHTKPKVPTDDLLVYVNG